MYTERNNIMFAVVEFQSSAGGGVSAVNAKWLTPRKKNVYWPPYKNQNQFNRALKQGEDVNPASWELYPLSRIFHETGKQLTFNFQCSYHKPKMLGQIDLHVF